MKGFHEFSSERFQRETLIRGLLEEIRLQNEDVWEKELGRQFMQLEAGIRSTIELNHLSLYPVGVTFRDGKFHIQDYSCPDFFRVNRDYRQILCTGSLTELRLVASRWTTITYSNLNSDSDDFRVVPMCWLELDALKFTVRLTLSYKRSASYVHDGRMNTAQQYYAQDRLELVQNRESLQSIAAQVSDPTHPNYLKFLSDEELHDRFAPTPQHVDEVVRWLNGSTYTLVSGRRWQLDVPSLHANTTIPHHLRSLVMRPFDVAITPLVVNSDSQQGMAYGIVVPQTLMTVYNTPNPTTYVAQNTVRYAVVSEQVTDSYLDSDLRTFANLSGVHGRNITAVNASGSTGPAGVESSLDLDSLISMAPAGASIQYIMNSNSNPFQWCTQILNTPNSSTWPHVVSFSWGQQEAAGVASELQGNDCLALLASAGVAVIASSGDDGVYGVNTYCDPNLGFLPSLPASSPYATAVGATTFPGTGSQPFAGVPLCNSSMTVSQMATAYGFTTGSFSDNPGYPLSCYIDKSGPEVAVSKLQCEFTSGGGFSTLFGQPSWQQAAVAAYLSDPSVPLPSASRWNGQNRAFPDVSMYGCGSPVLMGGALEYEGGTSQSAPLFAGVMGYVIDWYISRHGTGPGFLNPLLYQLYARNPNVFNDVVSGNNNGTSQMFPSQCALGGFTTAAGWDPVTGLGTPNIGAMIAELEQMFTNNSTSSTPPVVVVSTTSSGSSSSSMVYWVSGLLGGLVLLSACVCYVFMKK